MCLQDADPLAPVLPLETHLNVARDMIWRLVIRAGQLLPESLPCENPVALWLHVRDVLDLNLLQRHLDRQFDGCQDEDFRGRV